MSCHTCKFSKIVLYITFYFLHRLIYWRDKWENCFLLTQMCFFILWSKYKYRKYELLPYKIYFCVKIFFFGALNFFKHALIYRILHLSISWVHGPIVQDFIPSWIIKALPFIWHVLKKYYFPLEARGYTSSITNLSGVTVVINRQHYQDVNSFKRYPKLLIFKYLRESRATVFYRKKST